MSFTGTFYWGAYRLWRRVLWVLRFHSACPVFVFSDKPGRERNTDGHTTLLYIFPYFPLVQITAAITHTGMLLLLSSPGPMLSSHRQAWSTALGLWSCCCWQAHWCHCHGAAFWDERFPLHLQPSARPASMLMMHVTAYLHLHISRGILFFQWHLYFLLKGFCGLEIPRCVALVPWVAFAKTRQKHEESSQPHAKKAAHKA